MEKLRPRSRRLAIVAALTLLAVACGDAGAEQAEGDTAEAPTEAGTTQTGATPGTDESPAAPQDLEPARFAFSGQAVSPLGTNFAVGLEMGYYEQEGIGPVDIIAVSDHGAVAAGLDSGELDFGVGSPTFMLSQLDQGSPPPGINYFAYTYPFKFDWVVLPDSEVDSASELSGMTVGVDDLGRIAPIVAEALLDEEGIPIGEVEVIATGGGVAGGQALGSGAIDAMLADDTMLGQWEIAGIEYRTLPRPDEVPLIGSFYVQTLPETISEDPGYAVGFARAVAKGSVFALENIECAAAMFIKHFPQSTPQGTSEEEAIDNISTIVGKRAPLWSPENIGEDQWGVTIPELWEAEMEYQDMDVDFSGLYTNDLIDEINDFDAEAVRADAQACDPAEILGS
jgi:NitT/TauT family transport system substrate-binding protein